MVHYRFPLNFIAVRADMSEKSEFVSLKKKSSYPYFDSQIKRHEIFYDIIWSVYAEILHQFKKTSMKITTSSMNEKRKIAK